MKCKDYIQDSVWGAKNSVDYSIYGWRFEAKKDKLSKRYLLLAMRWRGIKADKLKGCLENIKGTVENLEKRLGIPLFQRTRFSRILKGSHFVIYGSPMWLRCVGTVSFFTWMLRASFENDGRTIESIGDSDCPVGNDTYYFKGGKNFISQLLGQGIESFSPDWSSKSVIHIHNNGFVKYSRLMQSKMPTFSKVDAAGSFVTTDPEEEDEDEDWNLE
jgi:hypothetical protein